MAADGIKRALAFVVGVQLVSGCRQYREHLAARTAVRLPRHDQIAFYNRRIYRS
jgi:hypothetical protein